MPDDDPTRNETRMKALRDALDPRLDIATRQRMRLLETFRGRSADDSTRIIDEMVLRNSVGLARDLLRSHEELKARIAVLTAPPHFPAVFLGLAGERRARVALGGGERVVTLPDDTPRAPGDTVLLNSDRTMIVGSCERSAALGDVANFVHKSADGRVVVSHRGESRVCQPVNGLKPDILRKGDAILIDVENNLAIEQVTEPPGGRLPFEIEDPSNAGLYDIGGLDEEMDTLLWTLLLGVEHAETARRMRLGTFTSVLLHGPPGTGKTLMARAAAGELQRRSGTKTRFVSIQPSEWRSEWVGSTERAIRETFRAIRRLATDGGHVVVFLDEADSLGRVRGSVRGAPVLDDFTNALLAELDGFTALGNVAIISASNRKDMLDPALRERLSAVDIPVPRPKLAAARSIFRVHLREDDAWAGEESRDEAIETALSLIYAPAGESNKVARIRFNDGSARMVGASELASGRLIQQIADNARRLAARRLIACGGSGICPDDVRKAAEDAIDGLRTVLSRNNAESCLADLPQDLAITAVEPVWPTSRKAKRSR